MCVIGLLFPAGHGSDDSLACFPVHMTEEMIIFNQQFCAQVISLRKKHPLAIRKAQVRRARSKALILLLFRSKHDASQQKGQVL